MRVFSLIAACRPPPQICNWPMTLRGSSGSPLSALAQRFCFVFVLANVSALMTHFLQASVALPAALTSFAMRLLIITWYQSRDRLWLVKASPWLWCTARLLAALTPRPYYAAGSSGDIVFTSHFLDGFPSNTKSFGRVFCPVISDKKKKTRKSIPE